ncbi:MAG: MarR family winged helix-turn-helix transcriptional regulator [Pseudomonadota bacterium]
MPEKLDEHQGKLFELFNEIGIIQQLGRAFFEERLPDGMVLPHFSVLNHLTRVGEGRTPVQIARAFQVPKNSLTHTLAGLEARGLIEMRPNPKDKRSKTVWLTDAGRAFRAETMALVSADMVPVLPEMEPDDVVRTLGFLRHLRETMDRARD